MTRFAVVPTGSTVYAEMHSSLHPIHTETRALVGTIEGELGPQDRPDLDQPHSARLQLPADAIKSGNRLQDMEMHRRMEVGKFPLITVTVDRAWPVDGTDRYRAAVQVSAHGNSAAFEEDFQLKIERGRLVIEGEHVFDMRDFDISPPSFLGLSVQPQVGVRVRIVAEQEASNTR